MFSDATYLLADGIIPEAKFLDYKETLPDGKKVNQKKLAEEAVFAAFAYLYRTGAIDLSVHEGKILFIKTRTAKARKLKETPATGLERVLHSRIGAERNIQDAVHDIFRQDVMNPWGSVIDIIKDDLTERGVLKKEVKGKVLFVTTYKHTLAKKIPESARKELRESEETAMKIKADGELHKLMMKAIAGGLAGRQEQRRDND